MGASAPFEALNVTVSEAGAGLGRDHEGANWRPRRRRTLAVKRAMDVIGAAFGLVLFSPLLLMVGVWIVVVDDNSPIFRQERVGLGGRRFVIYKFRTVYTRFCDPTGRTIFGPADNRLLPSGRFLRSSRIDELPQLLNILRGEMSLVGPRPHIADMLVEGRDYASLAPGYDQRADMLPGLTGWAQCHGLHGTLRTTDEAIARLEHDLTYVRDFSILLDLKILARTVFHVLAILRS